MTARKARLATVAVVAVAIAAIAASATVASAFPNKTSACTGCHSSYSGLVVTATQTANDGVNATYSLSISNPWNDGVIGWAVFDGSVSIRNGYNAGTFTVPVGKTYTVWAVAGSGGNGAKSITISPSAPAPADTTAPTVALTSPANGTAVSGVVALTATASDAGSGVARVEFRVDGVLLGSDATAPYAASWDASAASVGSHSITVRAIDVAGNAATATVSVSIAPPPPPADTTAPTVAITSPADASTVSGLVSLAALASDGGSGIARIEFRVDGALVGSDSLAPFGASWDAALAAPGTHVITATAIDGAGNSTSTTASVTIASPEPPAEVLVGDVTVTVLKADGQPATGARVSLTDTVTGVRLVRKTATNGVATFSDVVYGTYTVSVQLKRHLSASDTVVVDSPAESTTLQSASRGALRRNR